MRLTIVLILIVFNLLGQTKDSMTMGRLKSVNLLRQNFREITPTLIYVKETLKFILKKSDMRNIFRTRLVEILSTSGILISSLTYLQSRQTVSKLLICYLTFGHHKKADSLKAKWKRHYSKITNHVIEIYLGPI